MRFLLLCGLGAGILYAGAEIGMALLGPKVFVIVMMFFLVGSAGEMKS